MIQSTAPIYVGNDVVDLTHPRCRHRPRGDRLPLRVLSPREMDWFAYPGDPQHRLRRLWSLWAAKETAFKVVSKLEGSPPVFRHREVEVLLSETGTPDGSTHLRGRVQWRGHRCQVQGLATPRFLHMIGWGGDGAERDRPRVEVGVDGWGEEEETAPPTPSERASGAHHVQSARARRLVQIRLASYLGPPVKDAQDRPTPRVRIDTSRNRPGRTPPRVLVDEELRPEIDLSISHHGRYVAWAFLVPAASPPPGPVR
jgi:phosphopantetheinyl transferase (holo-ACP synthase)